MMVLLGFVAHWCRMGIGTVWTGTETDQLLLGFLPVTLNKSNKHVVYQGRAISPDDLYQLHSQREGKGRQAKNRVRLY